MPYYVLDGGCDQIPFNGKCTRSPFQIDRKNNLESKLRSKP